MADKDFLNDMSIDDILNNVKNMEDNTADAGRIWSLAEIDELLGDDIDDTATASTEDIDALLKDLGIEGLEEENDAEISEEFSLDMEEDLTEELEEEETDYVVNSSDFAEDVSPLLDLDEIQEEIAEEKEEPQEEKAIDDVPAGQLTIEKTRVFNEVETRAIRKDDIDHNIGKSKVIKTGEIPKSSMEKDPYRERFFNKPELQLEKTQEHRNLLKDLPQQTIEKHGVVVKKPELEKTSEDGLSPIPTLLDAAEVYDAQQKLELETQSGAIDSKKLEDDELENQIVLEGFDEEEEVNIVSEAEEEAKLRKVRKDKASKFKLFPNIDYEIPDYEKSMPLTDVVDEADETTEDEGKTIKVGSIDEIVDDEEEVPVEEPAEEFEENEKNEYEIEDVRIAREFFGPKDARAVHAIFTKELNQAKLRMIASGVSLVVLLVCSIITSMFSNFSLFGNSPMVYSLLNLIVLLAISGLNFKAFTDAINKFKKNKKINSQTALSLSLVLGILQSLTSLAYGELVLNGMHIYSAVALLPVLLINVGEYIKLENDFTNFVLLNNERGNFYAVKQIDDEDVAFEVGRGLMIKDPDIRYRAKVDFPYRFVEMSRAVDPTAKIFKNVIPIALAAAIAVGLISAIIYRSAFVGISAITGVFLMAVPSASFISVFFSLKEANKKLNKSKGMISGYEAVEDALNTNAVIVDSIDMFNNDKTNIYGIKLFNSMRIDEAILYTAAVVIQSDGALTEVFDSIILENREMLPEVESLAYEEKLGCSGWIYNYRVLVGNRELLIKHNVEVQSKEEESKFTKGGKQVMYLAVEGKVAAMFVVGYGADEKTAYYFRALEKAGVNILVKTADANITEELVEQYFGLPRNFVKVISPVASLMFREHSEKEVENEPCKILCNGKTNSSLRSLLAAFAISEQKNICSILQYVGVGIGILLMAMFAFLSGLAQAGVLQMILFESLWTLLVVFIPQLVKKI